MKNSSTQQAPGKTVEGNTLIRIAQAITALCILVLGTAAIMSIFNPHLVSEASGFSAQTNYGITNVRTLGAPTLALALTALFGLIRRDWRFVLPASLYFLFNGSARVISLIGEGYEPVMIRGLILTFGLFAISQVAIYLLRAQGAKVASPYQH
ncbi:hypothetical protein [Pseudoteredinibacter isoporae]|uniref:hypothetical protein n=1 Tax=Pseudoteredinibacter isoporae TaxID=570281 RepID=UPI003103D134